MREVRAAHWPLHERERIRALLRYDILDTPAEEEYDEITRLASFICNAPIVLISLVDTDRQWFKARLGLDAKETPRDLAFCAHTICQEGVFVVNDALQDERFADNPLVIGDPLIRFYAGVPLVTPDGYALGTLCAIDRVPRQLSAEQIDALQILAKQVMFRLEMRRTHVQLRDAARKMLDLAATQDEFFAIISHDLMSPFTSILALSEILLTDMDELPPREQREMLQSIHASGTATLTLLDNLLEWSMLQTGRIKHRPTPLDVRALLVRVVSLLGGAARKKSLRLEVDTAASIYALADSDMIHSVLQNLVFNAIKFTPEGGSIRTSAELKGPMVEVAVTDTGVGMAVETVQQLFGSHLASNTLGTAGERGTGFGLLLCQQFVEKNGGTLQVESEPNKGTTFRLTMPRYPH